MSSQIVEILDRISTIKQTEGLPLFSLEQLDAIRHPVTQTLSNEFPISLFVLHLKWLKIEEKVIHFFGCINHEDMYTKFIILTQFEFGGSFPLRRSYAELAKKQRELVEESERSGHNLVTISIERETSNGNLQNLYYPIDLEKIVSRENSIDPNLKSNIATILKKEYHNTRQSLYFTNNIKVRPAHIASETWSVQSSLKYRPSKPRKSDFTIDLSRSTGCPGLASSSLYFPYPTSNYEFETHFEQVLARPDSQQLDDPESFDRLYNSWRALYGPDPPSALNDQMIDRIFLYFKNQPFLKKTLPQSPENQKKLEMHIRRAEEIGKQADRIPNTLRMDFEEEFKEIYSYYNGNSKIMTEDQFDILERAVQSIIRKIQKSYPPGLKPDNDWDVFPDYDHTAVDVGSGEFEEFYGYNIRSKVLRRVQAVFNSPLTNDVISFCQKEGTDVYKGLFVFKDYSLARLAKISSNYFEHLYTYSNCPLTGEELTQFGRFRLKFFQRRLKKRLAPLLFETKEKISEITFLDPVRENRVSGTDNNLFGMNEEILDDLCDSRSAHFFIDDLDRKGLLNHIYLTPKFLQHFDFRGITEMSVLTERVAFASNMLGFHLVPIHTGNEMVQKSWWVPGYTFNCPYGGKSHLYRDIFETSTLLQKTSFDSIQKMEDKEENIKDWKEQLPCEFKLHYRRFDPDDEKSDFTLVRYNMAHTHPLSMELFSKWKSWVGRRIEKTL